MRWALSPVSWLTDVLRRKLFKQNHGCKRTNQAFNVATKNCLIMSTLANKSNMFICQLFCVLISERSYFFSSSSSSQDFLVRYVPIEHVTIWEKPITFIRRPDLLRIFTKMAEGMNESDPFIGLSDEIIDKPRHLYSIHPFPFWFRSSISKNTFNWNSLWYPAAMHSLVNQTHCFLAKIFYFFFHDSGVDKEESNLLDL